MEIRPPSTNQLPQQLRDNNALAATIAEAVRKLTGENYHCEVLHSSYKGLTVELKIALSPQVPRLVIDLPDKTPISQPKPPDN